jgi:hypothetical protein
MQACFCVNDGEKWKQKVCWFFNLKLLLFIPEKLDKISNKILRCFGSKTKPNLGFYTCVVLKGCHVVLQQNNLHFKLIIHFLTLCFIGFLCNDNANWKWKLCWFFYIEMLLFIPENLDKMSNKILRFLYMCS